MPATPGKRRANEMRSLLRRLQRSATPIIARVAADAGPTSIDELQRVRALLTELERHVAATKERFLG